MHGTTLHSRLRSGNWRFTSTISGDDEERKKILVEMNNICKIRKQEFEYLRSSHRSTMFATESAMVDCFFTIFNGDFTGDFFCSLGGVTGRAGLRGTRGRGEVGGDSGESASFLVDLDLVKERLRSRIS